MFAPVAAFPIFSQGEGRRHAFIHRFLEVPGRRCKEQINKYSEAPGGKCFRGLFLLCAAQLCALFVLDFSKKTPACFLLFVPKEWTDMCCCFYFFVHHFNKKWV